MLQVASPTDRAKPIQVVQSIVSNVTPDQRERMLAGKSYQFQHSLVEQNCFGIAEVRKLTQLLVDEKRFDQIFCRIGDRRLAPENAFEALDALHAPNATDTWLRLTRVDEISPECKELVERFYSDLSGMYQRDIKSGAMKTFATLFVSSPGEVTPYHLDHTWNFLLQLSGDKIVYLFDPDDPRVLKQEDKERWYMEHQSIKQPEGTTGIAYTLRPGDAVHHPVNAPHWVQNGPTISVSLSLGLCLHESNRKAKVYQVNYLLRKLGIRPNPPGHSPFRDDLKASVIDLFSDRHPRSFDAVLFSGRRRLAKVLSPTRWGR